MGARSGEFTSVNYEVLISNGTPLEPTFQYFPGTSSVTCLRRKGRPGRMWRHTMMRHRPPWMVLGRRLWEPHVAGISSQMPTLERIRDSVPIADLAARRIDDIGAPFHLGDERRIEEVLRFRVQRRVDGDHIANANHGLHAATVPTSMASRS